MCPVAALATQHPQAWWHHATGIHGTYTDVVVDSTMWKATAAHGPSLGWHCGVSAGCAALLYGTWHHHTHLILLHVLPLLPRRCQLLLAHHKHLPHLQQQQQHPHHTGSESIWASCAVPACKTTHACAGVVGAQPQGCASWLSGGPMPQQARWHNRPRPASHVWNNQCQGPDTAAAAAATVCRHT
jgi:hypothetical protein